MRGRSRWEEQQHRFSKRHGAKTGGKCLLNHEHTDECEAKAEEAHQQKEIMKDLLGTRDIDLSADIVTKFQPYLNKLLMLGQAPYCKTLYDAFCEEQNENKKGLTFYERMKIDELVRRYK